MTVRRVIAACVLLALALRIPGFTDALGNDEAGAALVGSSWLRGETAPGAAQLYGAYWHDRPPLTPLLYGLADLAASAHGVRALGALAAALVVGCIVLLVRALGGSMRAAMAAGAAAAALTAAPTLRADHAYGELIAAPLTLGALLALVTALAEPGRPRLRRLALAGALAACAVLVKQSAIDAPLAGTIGLVVTLARARTRANLAALGAWLAGALVPVAAVLGWAAATGNVAALWEATVSFRVDVLDAAGADATPAKLALPLAASGLILLIPLALAALRTPRTRLLLGAWLAASTLGVLGGGFYWGHYLIQLVPVLVVAATLALDRMPRRGAGVSVALCAGLLACTIIGTSIRHEMPHSGINDALAREVGEWVADRAAPGDEMLVLFARPGVVHASGLRSASPYLWTAMQATRADNRTHILAALRRAEPPRFVVRWNRPAAFGLDADGAIGAELDRRYRPVTRIGGREVLERAD